MNFFFAIFLFAFIAQVGEQTRAAVIAGVTPGSKAEQMGFRTGDRILQVGSDNIRSYEEFQKNLNLYKNSQVTAVVEDAQGQKQNLQLSVSSMENPNIFSLEKQMGQIEGIELFAKATALAVIKSSAAYNAGFRTGDEIISINDQPVSRWTQLAPAMLKPASDLIIGVNRTAQDSTPSEKPVVTSLKINLAQKDLQAFTDLKDYGFDESELYLNQVVKDSPAGQADLQRFDKIISINGKQLLKWDDISDTVKSFDGKESLTFVVLRDGAELTKKITPQVTELTNAFGATEKRFTIGITSYQVASEPEMTVVRSSSIFESINRGYHRTIDISIMTVMSFVKLFQGQTSVKNLGGMVSIGKAAKDSFELGAQAFLMTMGILSVSLFILNLLPIPVLDGGHLVFYTIEVIKGSPLSLKKMEIAQQVGFVLLIGLMILAQFNDIVKFLFKS